MAKRRVNNSRHNPVLGVTYSAVSGILITAGVFSAKIVLTGNILELLTNPLTYLAGGLALAGFLVMQVALKEWHLSAVMPMITGISVLTSNVLGLFFFAEMISNQQWLAVLLILLGIMFMAAHAKSNG